MQCKQQRSKQQNEAEVVWIWIFGLICRMRMKGEEKRADGQRHDDLSGELVGRCYLGCRGNCPRCQHPSFLGPEPPRSLPTTGRPSTNSRQLSPSSRSFGANLINWSRMLARENHVYLDALHFLRQVKLADSASSKRAAQTKEASPRSLDLLEVLNGALGT
jgi:hypothetical protein